MKRFASLVTLVAWLGSLNMALGADVYWDANGTDPGLFNAGSFADGTWNTTGLNWSTSTAGTDAAVWVDGNKALFKTEGGSSVPGNTEPDAVVTIDTGTRATSGLRFEDGWTAISGAGIISVAADGLTVASNAILSMETLTTPTVAGYTGQIQMGANTVTVNAGGKLSVNRISVLNNIQHAAVGGGIVLDGGTYSNADPNAVGVTFYPANGNITIGPSGIGYVDVPIPAQTTNTYTPVIASNVGIKGTLGSGATTENGGAGTIVKTGDGELRIGAAGTYTFAKLVVQGSGLTPAKLTGTTSATSNTGEYRMGNQTVFNENTWGAIPLAPLADAITLDGGGMIGANASHYMHPNRGVVIAAGGGGSWGTGGGVIAITGVLSGTGPLLINGATGGGSLALENPSNTWSGHLIMRNGSLILNQSLVATHIEGENQAGATLFGTVNIAPGKSLTVGSDNVSSQFDGRVTGAAGTFNKVGTGTLTLDTHAAGGEWTNLGTVNINGGTLQFAQNASAQNLAGFGNFTTVNIAAAGTLDMNSIQDQWGGLTGAGNVINHNATVNTTLNAVNLNLRGLGNYDYSGTITGTGMVQKNGPGTQSFNAAAGQAYDGGTIVLSGRLNANNTSGSGTGSGAVTVTTTATPLTGGNLIDSGGTLGGTGSVSGAITVDSGGHVTGGTGAAPSNKVLSANGSVTVNSGGSIDALLGAPGSSDRLKVASAGGLTLNSGGLLTLVGNSGAINGAYTVLEYNGYASGSAASLDINNATGFEMAGGLTDNGTSVSVTMTNTVQNRTWAMDGSGNWSAAAADATNWSGGSGGQVNGPGAIGNFNATASAVARTVTITDSNKTLGTLNLNDGAGGSYTIAAAGSNRLVMDTYSGNAAINVTAGNHTISAPLTTNKLTNVATGSNTLNITGGLLNNGGAGLVNTGAGTIAISAGPGTNSVTNRPNAKIENAGTGNITFTVNGGHNPTNTTTVASNSVNNDAGGRILNSGSGNLTINLITTSDLVPPATTRNAAISLLINNGVIENSGSGTLAINHSIVTATPGSVSNSNAITTTAAASDVITSPGLPGQFVNSGSGTMTIAAPMAASSGVSLSNSLTGTLTVSGNISGGLGLGDSGRVYIDGPGEVSLTGSNTYTGGTVLKQGKLVVTAESASGGSQMGGVPIVAGGYYNNVTFDGGTLKTNPSAALTINSNRGFFAKSAGTIETAGTADVTFAGRIHGAGTLAKTGARALLLNGNSITYSGALSVNEGTLGGTGSIKGSLAVNNTGRLAPGAGAAGVFSVGGTAAFNAGSNFDVEIGGTTVGTQYDQLAVTGAATLGGALNASLISAFAPAVGNSFTILTASSVTGTFASTSLPSLSGAAWQVVYNPTSVVLNVIAGGLAGDYNNDNKVDAADYVVWRRDPGSFGGPGGYNTWRSNFGAGTGSGSGSLGGGAVPEPASLGLVAIAVAALVAGRRHRK